mmetsp:Transcript_7813/g.12406  ORF Transcript_7813/g.12406 Transcript_7813/m.12406 type:complete len:116 (-) Transcript_7813:261-608(-)
MLPSKCWLEWLVSAALHALCHEITSVRCGRVQFDSLVIHSSGDAFYAQKQGSSLSWWNHGKQHATAELYGGKDSWIASLGSHNFGVHKTTENNSGNSALYATGFKTVVPKKQNDY